MAVHDTRDIPAATIAGTATPAAAGDLVVVSAAMVVAMVVAGVMTVAGVVAVAGIVSAASVMAAAATLARTAATAARMAATGTASLLRSRRRSGDGQGGQGATPQKEQTPLEHFRAPLNFTFDWAGGLPAACLHRDQFVDSAGTAYSWMKLITARASSAARV